MQNFTIFGRFIAGIIAGIGRLPAAALSVALIAVLSGGTAGAQEQEKAPKVSVAAAYMQDITEEVTFIGRVEAIDKVDIIARVSGFLKEKLVQDGMHVEEGDLLFRIEPDFYEATLAAREAELDQAQANLDLRRVELQRKEELLKRGAVPVSERDVAKALELVAEAAIKSAQAAIRRAELDLSYTEIRAPFPGRIGRIAVSVGDVVGPETGPLVTLVRETPVHVVFSVTEKQLVNLLQQLGESVETLVSSENNPDVLVVLPNGAVLEETGKIAFIDNRIDPRTGSISVRATFANDDRLLVDGSFVQVRIRALEPVQRLLIPQAALQRDQRGPFVLVVNGQGTVEQRYIQTGDTVDTAVIVTEGLNEGEVVIVEGLQRVRPGVTVEAVTAGTGD